MRDGWQTVKLGDVLKTSSGGTPKRSKKEYYEGGEIPWLMCFRLSLLRDTEIFCSC